MKTQPQLAAAPLRKNKRLLDRPLINGRKTISRYWSSGIDSRIRRIVDYIHINFYHPLRLIQAGKLVGLHPDHICRKFKEEMGINFREYIHRVRLQRAVFLLLGSKKIIKEITYEIGYSNPQLFSKAFKRGLGCSPKAYRAQHQRNRKETLFNKPFRSTPLKGFTPSRCDFCV